MTLHLAYVASLRETLVAPEHNAQPVLLSVVRLTALVVNSLLAELCGKRGNAGKKLQPDPGGRRG